MSGGFRWTREPINRAPGESRRVLRRRRISLDEGRQTGNRKAYLRASESLYPTLNRAAQKRDKRRICGQPCDFQLPPALSRPAKTFFGTRHTTHFTARAIGRQRKLEAQRRSRGETGQAKRHPSLGSLAMDWVTDTHTVARLGRETVARLRWPQLVTRFDSA